MTTVLAIDPGTTESAFTLIDADTRRPLTIGKLPNAELRDLLPRLLADEDLRPSEPLVAIEMIASYGMRVGAEVFETAVWIGRFSERCRSYWRAAGYPELVYRRDVKLHHCGSVRANDANVRQALCDRFAPGVPNKGKGTKAAPGFFYGFRSDIWAAFAIASYVADRDAGYQP